VNSVHLIGRLTRDPDLRAAKDGTPVALLRLAVPRRPGGDDAVFVDVACFDRLATLAGVHLGRGRRIAVEGRLDQREWTDGEGERRERHGVVAERFEFLDPPPPPKRTA
jgi:single-strand DNA-binding protein